jgi:hypothetical protein
LPISADSGESLDMNREESWVRGIAGLLGAEYLGILDEDEAHFCQECAFGSVRPS